MSASRPSALARSSTDGSPVTLMATTTRKPSRPANPNAAVVGAKAKDVGGAIASTARRVPGPALMAGAAAASLAGGLAIGSRVGSRGALAALSHRRRSVLGLPIGSKPKLATTAASLGRGARQLGAATSKASTTADDIHKIREHLEQDNRRSPIEVVLDGLTHRGSTHRRAR